jgi:hypothetical protein
VWRYASDIASFPATVGLQRLGVIGVWTLAGSTVTAPSTINSWQSLATSTTSGGTSYQYIRFVMDGSLTLTSGINAKAEFDTVTIDLETPPTVSLGAETATNYFNFKLTNLTSSEWIQCKTICPNTTALTVNCSTKSAYLADGSPVVVLFSSVREAWLDLSSGTNNLQFDDTGTVAVTLAISHEDRTM